MFFVTFAVNMQIKIRLDITDFVKECYKNYFDLEISHEDKSWVPHKVCQTCVATLRNWSYGKGKSMPFCQPMIWREPKSHDDCYFCACVDLHGYNSKNCKNIKYPNVTSVTRPILKTESDVIPSPSLGSQQGSTEFVKCDDIDDANDGDYIVVNLNSHPKLFDQEALNDLVRDLNLPKDKAELLGSRLHERNLLSQQTTFSWYRNREKEYVKFFTENDSAVFCHDIPGLMDKLGLSYNPKDGRFFLDASKYSLKGVLLHNGNIFASIPIFHSVHLKEIHSNVKFMFDQIKYENHMCKICSDLKVISLILGH